MKCCFIIPCYRHGATLASVLEKLRCYGIPSIVIDDGNDQHNKELIAAAVAAEPGTLLVVREKNGGKGRAMNDGIRKAAEAGFTHAFQIDADGQHDAADCKEFLQLAAENPDAVLCGFPVYDSSVPAARKNGREFSNIWARIVTLNPELKDVLCGFRVYPVQAYNSLLSQHVCMDSHMGFDVDILVRLSWAGCRFIFRGVHVTYPEDGVSNFRLFRDNAHISLTYTKLFFGMLIRLPILLVQAHRRKHHG